MTCGVTKNAKHNPLNVNPGDETKLTDDSTRALSKGDQFFWVKILLQFRRVHQATHQLITRFKTSSAQGKTVCFSFCSAGQNCRQLESTDVRSVKLTRKFSPVNPPLKSTDKYTVSLHLFYQ